MNHSNALMELSLKELGEILSRLHLTPFENAAKSWFARTVANYYEDEKKLTWIITFVGEDTISDLLIHIHTGRPLKDVQIKVLSDYGIVVNSRVPEDFRDRLLNWSKSRYVRRFPTKLDNVHHSFFMRSVLMLAYFERVKEIKLTRRKNDRNVRKLGEALFLEKEEIWKVINTLVRIGLIQKTKDLYKLNTRAYMDWRNEPVDIALEKFYNFNAGNLGMRLINRIAQYQHNPEDWVDMSVFAGTSTEYDQCRYLGLIQTHNDAGKTFVQLRPESWFLTKKEFHPLWKEKTILVSAAFEVLVPFHCEPFILFELLPACIIKDFHYFLVLDIDLSSETLNSNVLSDFYNTLVAKTEAIPDVVKYDLEESINYVKRS
ncbi:hypothetical protein [Cytobacillus firmus]|uniref:hypothetical protein n=1 Tax=Cytobacillus firmus TaxID=1399 RepID=UPI0021624454|nr:hypothetical protein [Cytobacillus firmus]MCS0674631.1 hypothetical protein [Cytobacillus firmus]